MMQTTMEKGKCAKSIEKSTIYDRSRRKNDIYITPQCLKKSQKVSFWKKWFWKKRRKKVNLDKMWILVFFWNETFSVIFSHREHIQSCSSWSIDEDILRSSLHGLLTWLSCNPALSIMSLSSSRTGKKSLPIKICEISQMSTQLCSKNWTHIV